MISINARNAKVNERKKDNKNNMILTLYLSAIVPPIKLKNIIGIADAAATIPKLIAEPVRRKIRSDIATIIKRCPNMANNDPSQYILKSLEVKATNGFIFAYALCPLLETMLVFISMSTVFPERFNPFAVSKAGVISEIFVTCIPCAPNARAKSA